MAGINKVILIGHLGKDPEVRYTPSGVPVCNFTLATSKKWTDKSGSKQERTEWHKITCFQKTAELCGEHLQKGRQVFLEGELQTRMWEDKQGVKHYTTEILANQVTFLGAKDESGRHNDAARSANHQPDMGYDDPGSDVPF